MTTAELETPIVPAPAAQEPPSLFRYATWVHLGAGAGECDDVDEEEGTSGCRRRVHFHAWCRLPNPLQHAEIRERALAAKARKIRQLRDASSDAYAILEEEFDAKMREGERARKAVIAELISLDFWKDYFDARTEVLQIEDPHSEEEDDKLYGHIDDDRARCLRLQAMPEETRPKDEYEELQRHVLAFEQELDKVYEEIVAPKRQAFESLSTEDLLEALRDKRIENEATREFSRVYEIHEWLSCAFRELGGATIFADLAALEQAPPEVIVGLQAAFSDLKKTAQDAQGN